MGRLDAFKKMLLLSLARPTVSAPIIIIPISVPMRIEEPTERDWMTMSDENETVSPLMTIPTSPPAQVGKESSPDKNWFESTISVP
jgi:hypothetical protein